MRENMKNRIELWIFPTGNVAVYRGNTFIPTEQLTEEERLFILDRVYDKLNGKGLDAEIKKYTENLYNETFGRAQGTLDEFDWEDIATVIEDTAKYFYNLRPHWKPSEEQIYALGTVVKGAGDCAVGSVGYNLNELYEQLKKLM